MDLEVLRKSAEMCGHAVKEETFVASGMPAIYATYPGNPKSDWRYWTPFTNAEQRWECIKKLLDLGYDILYEHRGWHRIWWSGERDDAVFIHDCIPEEFPARALAALKSPHGSGRSEMNKEVENKGRDAERWIPVSERLPEKGVPVVTVGWNYGDATKGQWLLIAWTGDSHENGEWWHDQEGFGEIELYTPTHWMPLPNPPAMAVSP